MRWFPMCAYDHYFLLEYTSIYIIQQTHRIQFSRQKCKRDFRVSKLNIKKLLIVKFSEVWLDVSICNQKIITFRMRTSQLS